MPFFAIPGTYHVKGLSPDGDSIRYKATDPDHWNLLDVRLSELIRNSELSYGWKRSTLWRLTTEREARPGISRKNLPTPRRTGCSTWSELKTLSGHRRDTEFVLLMMEHLATF